MPPTTLTNLSEAELEDLQDDWNPERRGPEISYEGDWHDTSVRIPEIKKWMQLLDSQQWPDYERWEEVPGGHYGHTDAAVWKAIKRVFTENEKNAVKPHIHPDMVGWRCELCEGPLAADIGCIRGLYPAMLVKAGAKKVTVFELNNVRSDHPKVEIMNMDLTRPTQSVCEYFDIITCVSTVEHIGLGRYGDPIDGYGDLKMMKAIRTILKKGGYAIISFPFDERPESRGKIVWNLHRVYNTYRKDLMFNGFEVVTEEDIGRFQPTWLLRKI